MTGNERRQAVAAAARALAGELDDHPSYEMLAAAVDGTDDDVTREIVDGHVATCASCDRELSDLRAFAGRADRLPARWMWWLASAAAIVLVVVLSYRTDRSGDVRHSLPPQTTGSEPAPSIRVDVPHAQWSRLVAEALRAERVEIPADVRALAARDAFRGVNTSNAPRGVVKPSATAIDETRPRFTWSGVAADDYQVSVYWNDREIAHSPRQRTTSWVCTQSLERGETYRWQIVARRGGESFIIPPPPAPPAIFRVLPAPQSEELAAAAREHPGDDLLLGVLYARAGVMDRAREHLSRYAMTTQSPTAKRLLSSLDLDR